MSPFDAKKSVGLKAAEWAGNGMLIGLGTGSTARYFTVEIGRRVKQENLQIRAVTSSQATLELARELEIPLIENNQYDVIDLYVDGADEIDPEKNLIKGAGGAMVQEKVLAANSREFIVIADSSKMVPRLCSRFPVPVEFVSMAGTIVLKELTRLGAEPRVRQSPEGNGPVITDQGNLIADARFSDKADSIDLDVKINQIPGVLGHGLFINLATKIITTDGDAVVVLD